MDFQIKGTVASEPKMADEKRITFLLNSNDNGKQVSCLSSIKYNAASHSVKRGDAVVLTGDWVQNLPNGGKQVVLLFEFLARG